MSESLSIRYCTDPDALFCRYASESKPQPAYIELGLRDGVFLASYDSAVGPRQQTAGVFSGIDRRWTIPILSGGAANNLLSKLAVLAQRVLDGAEVEWDGNNHVGQLITDDANEAYTSIAAHCEAIDATGRRRRSSCLEHGQHRRPLERGRSWHLHRRHHE
ncbi:hypothetical protein [Streptomyces sp. LN590]|uniref:hypothetical protein n=1 Tax=Streptomyces sp. LN590 TaxID=3112980 RepID=UPI003722BF3C